MQRCIPGLFSTRFNKGPPLNLERDKTVKPEKTWIKVVKKTKIVLSTPVLMTGKSFDK